jgi:hypothetical protein
MNRHRNNASADIDQLLVSAGGDGCAVAVPRHRARIFSSHVFLFSHCGRIIEFKVVVSTRRRWEKHLNAGLWGNPDDWSVVEAGPLVIAVRMLA